MVRSRLALAAALSLLLHVLLWFSLDSASVPRATPTVRTQPLELAWFEEPPPPPPEPAPGPEPVERAPSIEAARPRRQRTLKAPAPPTGQPEGAARSGSPDPDAPLAATRRPLQLAPSLSLPGMSAPSPAPGGRLLLPDDPSLSAEVLRAEEVHRVEGRVGGFLDDELAAARAQRGLPHPWWGGIDESLEKTLGTSDGGTPADMGMRSTLEPMLRNYLSSAEDFAKTGNPGLPSPGLATPQSVRQRELFGSEAKGAQALAQAGETYLALRFRGPVFSMKLELLQLRSGALDSVKLLETSGNERFDAFVLKSVPSAIAQAGTPPSDVSRREKLRSIWQIDGWLATEANLPGLNGIPLDVLKDQLELDGLRFRYRAQLLRVLLSSPLLSEDLPQLLLLRGEREGVVQLVEVLAVEQPRPQLAHRREAITREREQAKDPLRLRHQEMVVWRRLLEHPEACHPRTTRGASRASGPAAPRPLSGRPPRSAGLPAAGEGPGAAAADRARARAWTILRSASISSSAFVTSFLRSSRFALSRASPGALSTWSSRSSIRRSFSTIGSLSQIAIRQRGGGNQKCQGNGSGSHAFSSESETFCRFDGPGARCIHGGAQMADTTWEEQFKVFLKRAGDDLKRMGEDIRTEAQRLATELEQPERQEKMREGLRDVGQWARRTVNDMADLVEKGAQKAETAFRNISEQEQEQKEQQASSRSSTASRPETTARPARAAAKKAAPRKKTVGSKKSPAAGTAAKKKPARTAAAPKKSIGRKPRS